jgi:hypothetical protein
MAMSPSGGRRPMVLALGPDGDAWCRCRCMRGWRSGVASLCGDDRGTRVVAA